MVDVEQPDHAATHINRNTQIMRAGRPDRIARNHRIGPQRHVLLGLVVIIEPQRVGDVSGDRGAQGRAAFGGAIIALQHGFLHPDDVGAGGPDGGDGVFDPPALIAATAPDVETHHPQRGVSTGGMRQKRP